MKIPNKIDVNTCKSPHCKNFSIPGCKDYIIPSFNLGFPAVHCNLCGGNSLLINNKDLEKLLIPYFIDYNINIEKSCPKCLSTEKICYGFTLKKNRRYKCKECNHVYTIKSIDFNIELHCKIATMLLSGCTVSNILDNLKISASTFYRLLYKTASLLEKSIWIKEKIKVYKNCELQTNIFKITCSSDIVGGLNNDLLGLVTCCAKSGYVYLVSVNWDSIEVSLDSRYEPTGLGAEEISDKQNTIKTIYEKYESFKERPNFDHYNYTNKYCSKNIFNPILLAHFHFHKIKLIVNCIALNHYIYTDPFIRSACINANGELIRKNEKCNIYYVISNNKNSNAKYVYRGSYKVGWWGNIWEEYYSHHELAYKYTCKLTNLDKLDLGCVDNISLDKTSLFIKEFKSFFSDGFTRRLSPRVFVSILKIFTVYFNYCHLTTGHSSCPAKKLGLTNTNFDIKTLFYDADKVLREFRS